MDLREIINKDTTTIVDVREPYEFASGNAKGAINIPLGTVASKVEDFRNMSKPIVVHCRSGMRSAQAMGLLKALGVQEVYNGGSLDEVMYLQRQTV